MADHKSGFVAVVGKPNVGKSTLINSLLGQKIAAVSPRPQTTRKQQMGILTLEKSQIIFVDTPGVHKPRHKLGEAMNKEATQTLDECDLILFIVEGGHPPDDEDILLAESIITTNSITRSILVINKCDSINEDRFSSRVNSFKQIIPVSSFMTISATRGDNLDKLLKLIINMLPEGPAFFPEGQITDLYERDIAADLIREASLRLLRDEVPHSIAVRIDQYVERNEHGAFIEATLFVERESQKGIVIGKGGSMLKKIGSISRSEIELMSGRKVFLRLRVKVRKNWRNDNKVLSWFGY